LLNQCPLLAQSRHAELHCTCPLLTQSGHCVLESRFVAEKYEHFPDMARELGRRTLQREVYSQNIIHFIFVPEGLARVSPGSSSCWCAVSSRTQQCPLMTQSGYPNYQNLIASSASTDFRELPVPFCIKSLTDARCGQCTQPALSKQQEEIQ
jgi:hypothetical protein